MTKNMNEELLTFIKESPSCFHAVSNLKEMLKNNNYKELYEDELWEIEKGGKYYTTRNDSSIIAFYVGDELEDIHFQITSSHSDSPTFKVKENAVLNGKNKYLKLNVEGYGGMIASSWFDKPLSLAGRVLVKKQDTFKTKLLKIDSPILMIPNVAIHMNRNINHGYEYNTQIDLLPLFSNGACVKEDYDKLIADTLNVDVNDIISKDLYLYNQQAGCVWGMKNEFISSPKLDDLQCAFTSFKALVSSKNTKGINVAVCFDNEEVGSATKQGADSTFLFDTLKRINEKLGHTHEDYVRSIAKSFMISCDNAHAVHPNHPEKSDENNCVYMNEGIVVKHNANQKYTTDAFSSAIFKEICAKAKVSVQHFSNRSDMVGGSTLGNISSTNVSMSTVDIGLAQLAMHSSYETAGSNDTQAMIDALTAFYQSNVVIKNNNEFCIK